MKVVTTNLLNRFWTNGVKPIKDALTNKVDSSKIVNSLLTTAAGYALDACQGKALDDKITELNRKSIKSASKTYTYTDNIASWGTTYDATFANDLSSIISNDQSRIVSIILSCSNNAIIPSLLHDKTTGKISGIARYNDSQYAMNNYEIKAIIHYI